MSARPDLSVVIPLFNDGAWIAGAIDSVIERADGLLEVIVVDDGSTDDGPEIVTAYGDPVRLIKQANAGPPKARNTGIAAARGRLIGFLDADDIWVATAPDPRRTALEDPEVDLVMARVLPVAGDPPVACSPPVGSAFGSVLARRETFERFGYIDEDLYLGDDLDWLARVRNCGAKMASIEDIVVHYRQRPGSLTTDIEGTKRGMLLAVRAAIERAREQA